MLTPKHVKLGTMECTKNLANLCKVTNSTTLRAQTLHNLFIQPQFPRLKVAYIQIVVDICPQKAVPKCAWLTIGRDQVDYPGEVTTQTADLTTVKLHLSSVVSMPNGKFLGIDINNFYLYPPSRTPRICLHSHQICPPKIHWWIQSCTCHIQRIFILKSSRGHVWPPTSRYTSKEIAQNLTSTTWLHWMCTHAWTLEIYHQTNNMHPMGGLLWNSLYIHTWCNAPHQNITTMIQNHNWLDWHQILWSQTKMELWHHKDEPICWHLHAWLHQEMPPQI